MEERASRRSDVPVPARDGQADLPGRATESYVRAPITLGRSARRSRKGLTVILLIASDCLFAAFFWAMSYVLYGTLVAGQFPAVAPSVVAFNIAAWIVFRALVGLFT